MPRLFSPLCLTLLTVGALQAQSPMTGFSPGAERRERALEQLLVTLGDTARARSHSKTLSAQPHVAGTPAQQVTAGYVLRQLRGFGLDTSRTDFQVYIPYPESTIVELVSPTQMRLSLVEPALAEDSTSQGPIWPAMNGHAAPGDVTAPVVYV